jgi:hypothetical protein
LVGGEAEDALDPALDDEAAAEDEEDEDEDEEEEEEEDGAAAALESAPVDDDDGDEGSVLGVFGVSMDLASASSSWNSRVTSWFAGSSDASFAADDTESHAWWSAGDAARGFGHGKKPS